MNILEINDEELFFVEKVFDDQSMNAHNNIRYLVEKMLLCQTQIGKDEVIIYLLKNIDEHWQTITIADRLRNKCQEIRAHKEFKTEK